MKHKTIKIMITLLLCGVFFLTSCAPAAPVSGSLEAMDTFMNLTLYSDSESLEKLTSEIKRLDSLLSATDSESSVYKLNNNREIEGEGELADLLSETLRLCESTNGALDITVGQVVEAWGFISRDYRIPDSSELEGLLRNVDYHGVEVGENGRITLSEGTKIDLGAVAKGYAADRCTQLMDENGVESALLNLGGTVCARGVKPDGGQWKIGIADPSQPADYVGYFTCADKVVATSGSYERYFVGEDGRTYCHIINPADGYPSDNGIVSVTVISGSGLLSDALSTALFVMGEEKAEEYQKAHPDFDCIILTDKKEAIVSGGIADSFTLGSGSDYKIIRR